MEDQLYPTLTARIKAAVVDILILMAIMMAAAYIFSFFVLVPNYYRTAVFVFVFFFYDPLFISFLGGTPGHLAYKLRVKDVKNPTKNILLPLAVFRFCVKSFLGWLSFLTVTGNKKRRAIHDYAVGSVVFYKHN